MCVFCTCIHENTKSSPKLSRPLDCSLHSALWFAKLAARVHFGSISIRHTAGLRMDGPLMAVLMGTHTPTSPQMFPCQPNMSQTTSCFMTYHEIKGPKLSHADSTVAVFTFLRLFQEYCKRQLWQMERKNGCIRHVYCIFNPTSPWKLWANSYA